VTDIDRWIAQERFLREHHHLISPWAYSRADIATRQQILLKRNFK